MGLLVAWAVLERVIDMIAIVEGCILGELQQGKKVVGSARP